MDENGFRPEELAEKAEAAEKKAEEFASEALDNIENAAESVESAAEDALQNAAETAAEVKESAEDLFEEIPEKADEVKDDLAEKLDEAFEMIEEAEEKAAEDAEGFAEAAAETFEEKKEAILEDADELKENAEEAVDGVFTKIPEKAKEVKKDLIEAVSHSAPEAPADELQDFRTINSHKPSIPQYVPKTYTREVPAEPERSGVRGAADPYDYEGFPPVDDVEPAPKGVLNGKPAESSNKTVLWILLAVLICLIVAGCCLIQGFFGILNMLAG